MTDLSRLLARLSIRMYTHRGATCAILAPSAAPRDIPSSITSFITDEFKRLASGATRHRHSGHDRRPSGARGDGAGGVVVWDRRRTTILHTACTETEDPRDVASHD